MTRLFFFFFQAEDGIRDYKVTGVQTCALPISGEWEQLGAVLPERYRSRIVRAESLPLEYQEIRAPAMLPAYRRLMQVVWGTIDTAFSNRVITPGKTTTDDVAWWMRQRVNDLGFG